MKNSNFIRDLLIKLLLIVIFVFLLMKLIPMPNLTAYYDNIFGNNINSMKEAAKDYYTIERMPSENGKSVKMTLQEMLDQKLLIPFVDKDGNACDTKKSYVKVTKGESEYELKVSLTCGSETKYVIEKIGCYDFCTSGSCTLSDLSKTEDSKTVSSKTNQTEPKKEEVKTQTDNNGNITVVNNGGTYITEYEFTKVLTDESWKTGDWTVTKLDETDDIKLVDTKTEYTGQKKVDTDSTLYEEVAYGTNSYYVTDTNWSNEEKTDTNNILVDTRTLYKGEKKIENGTTSYEYIKYGTRDNWTYDENWTDEKKTETDTLKIWETRTLYKGKKEVTEEVNKYKYVKIGEKISWTQTGWTTANRKEDENIKVLETRYTVSKIVPGKYTICTHYQTDPSWYSSVPANTTSRLYNSSPVMSKVTPGEWQLIDSSYASIGSKMPAYSGDYKYDYIGSETTTCTKNCNGRSETTVYYYKVYKRGPSTTTYQYEYCEVLSSDTTTTDTKVVTNLKQYTDQGYTLVKTEWNYNVRSVEQYVEDIMWSDKELKGSEIPAGYQFANKSTTTTTRTEEIKDWVLTKQALGEYTKEITTKTQYRYKYNKPEKYVIDTKWTTSKVAPTGYESTGKQNTTTDVSYEQLKDWVETKELLGEYTNNIKTLTQYKYKHLVTDKYIKDTKWIPEKHAEEGYELTGNEKTTTDTTYVSLGSWVDSKTDLDDYTYNIETRKLYKYKTRSTSSTSETIWATENPGNGYTPTGRSRTKFIPNRINVQK